MSVLMYFVIGWCLVQLKAPFVVCFVFYFCSHCSIIRLIPFSPDAYRCEAKGKTININIPRPFCTLFELKKENQNEKRQA